MRQPFELPLKRCITLTLSAVLIVPSACTTSQERDIAPVVAHLQAATATLHELSADDQAVIEQLLTTVIDIAHERLITDLALEFDALLAADGSVDPSAIDRISQPEYTGALAQEIRLGRLTVDEAAQLLRDFAGAQSLSPQARHQVETQLLESLLPAQQHAALVADLRTAVEIRHHTRALLLDELTQLGQSLAQAAAPAEPTTPPWSDASRAAIDRYVDDPDLAQSISQLLDLLTTSPNAKEGDQ